MLDLYVWDASPCVVLKTDQIGSLFGSSRLIDEQIKKAVKQRFSERMSIGIDQTAYHKGMESLQLRIVMQKRKGVQRR